MHSLQTCKFALITVALVPVDTVIVDTVTTNEKVVGMNARRVRRESDAAARVHDVVLIGGGLMSATLGALLARLQPDWSMVLCERLDEIAAESSHPDNNAGTGHSGFCELNYMPNPDDPDRAARIARMFHVSRQFWAGLVESGEIDDPTAFVNPAPHMDLVFGERDVAYLRDRFETLRAMPLFSAMEYSEDHDAIEKWAPLLMRGRDPRQQVAATRYPAGTDIDFGALTKILTRTMTDAGTQVLLGHEVTRLERDSDGVWTVAGRRRADRRRFAVRGRFVFVGAGGYTLTLLQRAGIPEVRGFAVFPFGARFPRTDNPDVVGLHEAKVYSQAAIGAPPMSVPHLDRRSVNGETSLLFGPYASFSTRLLKHGALTDLFRTVRLRNIGVLLSAGVGNASLARYLVEQHLSSRRRRFAELRRFYPQARAADWRLVRAGQRAQLVKPGRGGRGVLTFGTELVTAADGAIAGLLGASPGASTAPAVMADLLARCFPEHQPRWQTELRRLMPGLTEPVDAGPATLRESLARTGRLLRLTDRADGAGTRPA
jgi:malate dehydrogenase (quinone)